MDLILWRHAEAQLRQPDANPATDMARVLTEKGRKQARKMGEWLDRKLANSCKILVSPAARTVQTAEALGRKFKVHPGLGPDACAQDILKAANWPDSKEPVLIVGHQPTLGQVAALLIAGAEQDWDIRKAGVWWIGQRVRADQGDAATTYLKAVLAHDLVIK